MTPVSDSRDELTHSKDIINIYSTYAIYLVILQSKAKQMERALDYSVGILVSFHWKYMYMSSTPSGGEYL